MNQAVSPRPVILTIGGSDSAGMAGIQADLRTITALGGHGASVITAVTAQNSEAVLSVNPVSVQQLEQQLTASVCLAPAAIKIGLLATVEQVLACADFLKSFRKPQIDRALIPVVHDPVLASSSGGALVEEGVDAAIRESLLPLCTLVTPNRDEAGSLTGATLDEERAAEWAASKLRIAGSACGRTPAIYLKGGHWRGVTSNDYFSSADHSFWLSHHRLDTPHQRGTGCTLASAAATALALGYSLEDAVVIGKMAVNQGLRQSYGWSSQQGPVLVTGFPDDSRDLPRLSDQLGSNEDEEPFPSCGPEPLGLYPVVDRADWLETLLPAGISTIQLRVKDLHGVALRQEIAQAIEIAERHGARLFINDYWQLAIELGAYGVHLGQADIADADVAAIRTAGLRLGISTHCHYEVAQAVRHRPSYLACGPVYPTTSKDMPWVPHGPEGLAYWRRVLSDYPLVAIGGIDRRRLPAVAAIQPDGIAMITALTLADDPRATARAFLSLMAADSYPRKRTT